MKTAIDMLTDDLDPQVTNYIPTGTRVERVEFSLDGDEYEIHLSEPNATELRKTVAKYIERSRMVSGPLKLKKREIRHSAPKVLFVAPETASNEEIRAWVKANGWPAVKGRGRIPAAAVAAYHAAH